MPLKIIVGPTAMYVERHGVRSETRAIGKTHGPEEVRAIATELWETIRPLLSWAVWVRHRLRMALIRKTVAIVSNKMSGPYFVGPGPDLIATKPWKEARQGDWTSLPHGVVSRLTRQSS